MPSCAARSGGVCVAPARLTPAAPLGLKCVFNNPQMHVWHHAKWLPDDRRFGMNSARLRSCSTTSHPGARTGYSSSVHDTKRPGSPRPRHDGAHAVRVRRRLLLSALLLSLLLATATAAQRVERLQFVGTIGDEILASLVAKQDPKFRYDGGWKLGHSESVRGKHSLDEFVPADESIDSWTRLFTQQNFARGKGMPAKPRDMMNGLKQSMERRCPGVVWTVLREGPADLLYEFALVGCGGHPDQHEIARILFGRWNIWRLAYSEKTAAIDEQTRAKWIKALDEPSIVKQ